MNLADYLSRAPEGQKEIYYLPAPAVRSLRPAPTTKPLKRNIEVLFLLEPIDEFVMNHAGALKKRFCFRRQRCDRPRRYRTGNRDR